MVKEYRGEGSDEASQYNYLTGIDIRWVAYHYNPGDYDGSGEAVISWSDGTYSFRSMIHCSCNRPWEDILEVNRKSLTWDEMLKELRDDAARMAKHGEYTNHYIGLWDALRQAASDDILLVSYFKYGPLKFKKRESHE